MQFSMRTFGPLLEGFGGAYAGGQWLCVSTFETERPCCEYCSPTATWLDSTHLQASKDLLLRSSIV